MVDRRKSSSLEQIRAEQVIFQEVEQALGVSLEQNRKLFLSDNAHTYIQPDFYAEDAGIIGEIFAHIGRPKKAQDNKIANDILKMLLLEKVTGRTYRKIIVVCDKDEAKKLQGLSALAEGIRRFGVEILRIEISPELRQQLLQAQERQKMVNE